MYKKASKSNSSVQTEINAPNHTACAAKDNPSVHGDNGVHQRGNDGSILEPGNHDRFEVLSGTRETVNMQGEADKRNA